MESITVSSPEVAVVLGSKSDEAIAEKVSAKLKELGISCDIKVISAHRNPQELEKYLQKSSAKVFIGIAGLAAHLPGFIASHTEKPVIGVPVNSKLGGLDALLSIVQMPRGVPVACVGIDNGENAALLAARILSVSSKRARKPRAST
jgi:5-(carboxyamino)imidazole ribonucleotide mutase